MRNRDASTGAVTVHQPPPPLASAQGRDFSSFEYENASLRCQNFFESIFNGCLFKHIKASQSIFQHTEFTEARFVDCAFEDTSFDHSDFVLASLLGTQFTRCSFQNAEWRDTSFENVQFRQCIFRSTTISLTTFMGCSFDETSSSSFIEPSKRYSLFSSTAFELPIEQINFLRCNFGVVSPTPVFIIPGTSEDPLFQLSVHRYAGSLDSKRSCNLLLDALLALSKAADPSRGRLRLKYISGICKLLVKERSLSVFAIRILERTISQHASQIRDREQALEVFSLILTLRVALQERLQAIEDELAEVPPMLKARLNLRLEFEETYDRPAINTFVSQLAEYCGLHRSDLLITRFEQGSTLIDVVTNASVFVRPLLRFIKCITRVSTFIVNELDRMAGAHQGPQPRTVTRSRTRKGNLARVGRHRTSQGKLLAACVTNECSDRKTPEAKAVEIFVDKAKQSVLVVDGHVKVTISLL
jgi:hypothetical protein